jgi:hypothetical protein
MSLAKQNIGSFGEKESENRSRYQKTTDASRKGEAKRRTLH